jgi:hypothetical protein
LGSQHSAQPAINAERHTSVKINHGSICLFALKPPT